MATYNGLLHYNRLTPVQIFRGPNAMTHQGDTKLIDNWGESGSGSAQPSNYPSGLAAEGVPVLRVQAGAHFNCWAAVDVGQIISAMVYPTHEGAVVMKIYLGTGGVALDRVYSTKSDQWERLEIALPSGYAKGIYLLEITNFASQQDQEAWAYIGPIEVT